MCSSTSACGGCSSCNVRRYGVDYAPRERILTGVNTGTFTPPSLPFFTLTSFSVGSTRRVNFVGTITLNMYDVARVARPVNDILSFRLVYKDAALSLVAVLPQFDITIYGGATPAQMMIPINFTIDVPVTPDVSFIDIEIQDLAYISAANMTFRAVLNLSPRFVYAAANNT